MQTAPIETVESAFARLHPRVQRQLWHMQWSHLRPLQVQAIQAIMTADAPVLLSTSTASGKTEAAFLPILSQLLDSPESSVRALYIGPLRALINDQFRRLEALCEDLEIPVHRWHGDIGATAKRKLIEQPKGVLLLTPESLESLFINRSPHLSRLFGGLQFVVIDELHVFLGKERGRHLQSLLARLERFTKSPARRIGLSATISQQEGQPAPDEAACHLLSPRDSHQVICITDRSTKPLGYRVYAHRESAQAAAEAGMTPTISPWSEPSPEM